MLIIQFDTQNTDNNKIIEQIKLVFEEEAPQIYTSEEVSISKRIPVYDTEDLKENLKKRNQSQPKNKIPQGLWQKRYRYANIWHFRCSVCGKTSPQSQYETPLYSFCPHCNSKMQLNVGSKENA